jgi:hypothetical protein
MLFGAWAFIGRKESKGVQNAQEKKSKYVHQT